MIEGVRIAPLRIIQDERGSVRHMLRVDDPPFPGFEFGEIYFSQVNPGVFKGWHKHKRMTVNYACVVGRVEVFLLQEIIDSKAKTGMSYKMESVWLSPDEEKYFLLTIPPGIWNGFRTDAEESAILANCATHPYDPMEIVRKHPSGFPFPEISPGEYKVAG